MNVGATRSAAITWRLLAIFVLALAIRLVYNLYIAQHRILDVGDSFYYLTGGRLLAKLVRESQSINGFFSQLCTAAKTVPGHFASFSSLGLSDRLLIDGPIYPSYLAAIFLITGKALQTAALNVNQLSFGLANSVTDSLLAVAVAFMGETAFGVTAGVLAGVLWCFYLPAVINTQQCYGEPVVALLLTLFIAALHLQTRKCGGGVKSSAAESGPFSAENKTSGNSAGRKEGRKPGIALSLLIGLLAGLVMLSKPVFVILPALLIGLHLIFLAFSGQLRARPLCFTALLAGVVIVLAPWLSYTRTISGAYQLIVNRAPGYNLYIGNYLPTDGWKTWPVVPGVPDAASDARKFIEQEYDREPGQFLSLLLRKVPRLWAGVWNDFHGSCFGISYALQNVFQALYMLFAALGLALLFAGRLRMVRPFSFAAAGTLAYAVAFHYVYVLFEPVPRYAFPAMPMVIALAAAGLVCLFERLFALGKRLRQRVFLRMLFLVLFVAFIAAVHAWKKPVEYLIATSFSDPALLRSFCGLAMFLVFGLIGTGLCRQLHRLKAGGPLFYLVMVKVSLVAGLIALASALGDPTYLEYSAILSAKKFSSALVRIALPNLGPTVPSKVYLLVDAQAEDGAPELSVMINEKRTTTYALPLYELTVAARDIPSLMNLQGRMMDVDQRTFRQWWIYPVDSSLFKFGQENVIALFPTRGVKIFGDYFPLRPDTAGGESKALPSLTAFSWSKGFLTADSRDPRPYEDSYFRGHAIASFYSYGDSHYDKGYLRLRVAVPTVGARPGTAEASAVLPPVNLLSVPEERQISGQNPIVFDKLPAPLPAPLPPASILHVHAMLRRPHPQVPATMALSLDYGAGKPLYTPVWQPSCLRISSQWEPFDYKTILPQGCEKWQQVGTHLMLSPYQGDRLYLHRKEALKDTIFVRDLTIEILPPPIPGGGTGGALKMM